MDSERVVLAAPAKINLYLGVGQRRDDGYHEVVTVMQAVQLHDTVSLEPAVGLLVECVPDLGVPPCDNLAAVAARVLGGLLDREPGVTIRIRKRIPTGGGLGGGSSDAAATLVGLGGMWGLAPDDPRVREAAEAVGTDVPFFLEGGCALLGGRGERLQRRLPTPGLNIAIVNAGVPVPTGAAYAAFDRRLAPPAPEPSRMLAAIERREPAAIASALHNDLTEVATGLAPEGSDALALLSGAPGLLGAGMTGSGSSMFGIFDTAASAEAAASAAASKGWWSVATGTRDGGVDEIGPGPGAEEGA